MKFDLSDFHVVHVLAAYAVTGLGMLGLVIVSLNAFIKSRRP